MALRRYALKRRREWIRDDPMDKVGPGFGILAMDKNGTGGARLRHFGR